MPEQQSDQDASVRRGAWYRDPYAAAEQQRWYDGTKWTREVRPTPADEQPPRVRIVGPPQRREDEEFAQPQRQEDKEWGFGEGQPPFGISMRDVVGEQLRLVKPGPKRWYEFELLSTRGRVATLSLLWKTQLASFACGEGAWSLAKERRFGWQLPIRGPDGAHVGHYSGRRWSPGGTISLASGAQFVLQHPMRGSWRLSAFESGEKLASLRIGAQLGVRPPTVTVQSLPDVDDDVPLVVLVGCAIVMLEQSLPVAGPGATPGVMP